MSAHLQMRQLCSVRLHVAHVVGVRALCGALGGLALLPQLLARRLRTVLGLLQQQPHLLHLRCTMFAPGFSSLPAPSAGRLTYRLPSLVYLRT